MSDGVLHNTVEVAFNGMYMPLWCTATFRPRLREVGEIVERNGAYWQIRTRTVLCQTEFAAYVEYECYEVDAPGS